MSECVPIYNTVDHDILHHQFSILPHLFDNLMEEKNSEYLLRRQMPALCLDDTKKYSYLADEISSLPYNTGGTFFYTIQ